MGGNVFVSYSQKDRDWMDRVLPFLDHLERDGRLEVFEDSRIDSGDEWYRRIETAIDQADQAILLVSRDFLASEFIRTMELPRLLRKANEGSLRIHPLVVRPVDWESSSLAHLEAVNDPQKTLLEMTPAEQERKLMQLEAMVLRQERVCDASPPSATEIDDKVAEVRTWLLQRRLSFYVGGWTSLGDPDTPPTPRELIDTVMERFSLSSQNEILIPLDVLGSYFDLQEPPGALDELLERLMADRSRRIPPLHTKLARLLRATQDIEPSRTHRRTRRQLMVITTNFDICLEKALLSEGVDFYRLVQIRGTGEIVVDHFRRRPEIVESPGLLDAGIVSYGDESSLDDAATDSHAVILFKAHGSADIGGSCCISCDHYYQSIRNGFKLPPLLAGSINKNRDLFLGYSLLDSDLRTLAHTFNRDKDRGQPYRGLFVHAQPEDGEGDWFRRLERSLWTKLLRVSKMLDLDPVDRTEQTFLSELLAALPSKTDA